MSRLIAVFKSLIICSGGVSVVTESALLLEDGTNLLLEDGSNLLLEA